MKIIDKYYSNHKKVTVFMKNKKINSFIFGFDVDINKDDYKLSYINIYLLFFKIEIQFGYDLPF